MQWNLADLFELVADTCPERPALLHGTEGRARTWRDLERREDELAYLFDNSDSEVVVYEGTYADRVAKARALEALGLA